MALYYFHRKLCWKSRAINTKLVRSALHIHAHIHMSTYTAVYIDIYIHTYIEIHMCTYKTMRVLVIELEKWNPCSALSRWCAAAVVVAVVIAADDGPLTASRTEKLALMLIWPNGIRYAYMIYTLALSNYLSWLTVLISINN